MPTLPLTHPFVRINHEAVLTDERERIKDLLDLDVLTPQKINLSIIECNNDSAETEAISSWTTNSPVKKKNICLVSYNKSNSKWRCSLYTGNGAYFSDFINADVNSELSNKDFFHNEAEKLSRKIDAIIATYKHLAPRSNSVTSDKFVVNNVPIQRNNLIAQKQTLEQNKLALNNQHLSDASETLINTFFSNHLKLNDKLKDQLASFLVPMINYYKVVLPMFMLLKYSFQPESEEESIVVTVKDLMTVYVSFKPKLKDTQSFVGKMNFTVSLTENNDLKVSPDIVELHAYSADKAFNLIKEITKKGVSSALTFNQRCLYLACIADKQLFRQLYKKTSWFFFWRRDVSQLKSKPLNKLIDALHICAEKKASGTLKAKHACKALRAFDKILDLVDSSETFSPDVVKALKSQLEKQVSLNDFKGKYFRKIDFLYMNIRIKIHLKKLDLNFSNSSVAKTASSSSAIKVKLSGKKPTLKQEGSRLKGLLPFKIICNPGFSLSKLKRVRTPSKKNTNYPTLKK